MITTLIVGWILTWFSLDNIIVNGINEMFKTDFTTAVYWLLFFAIGTGTYLRNIGGKHERKN